MPHKIVSKEQLSEDVFTADVEAPLIARAAKPGQFVIIAINSEYSERIPLTIADADPRKGTIHLIWQRVGKTTAELADMQTGDHIANVVGPLGRPTHIKNFGTVVCVGGGIGNAPLLPIAKALKKAGNKIITILGARTKTLLILEDEFAALSDELIITTDDGSYGRKALVTEPLKEICRRQPKPNQVIAIGPAIMMKFCCEVTKQFDIPTQVSLNTIMVDGTGMCGGCRIEFDGQPKFVCVDGPEFDGHKVNFDLMIKRLNAYKNAEQKAHEIYKEHRCKIGLDRTRDEQRIMMTERERQELLQQLLEKQKAGGLKPKDRYEIPPQDMPAQDAVKRRTNVSEVATGYTETHARLEAMRCLQCKNAPCIEGCPVRIKIKDFVAAIADGDFKKALAIIKENSLLPAVCGRVCPQEVQCQQTCTVGLKFKDPTKAVSIGRLERFVADLDQNQDAVPSVAPDTGMKVAIIGSGPGGIVAATDTRRAGHDVTIFEAFHKPGGVMVYGIPEFRLPKAIVQKEIDGLAKMGVKIVCNFIVGRTRTIEQLMKEDGFDAVYIGVGAGLPQFMGIEGESLIGVYSANEYLTRANLMKAYKFGKGADTPIALAKKVAVIGGGNVAMDSARTAIRLGAEKVYLVYRRSEKEMPARIEEVHHAKEEGVEFHLLQSPKRIIADQNSRVIAIECLKYQLGEPDESGRRRPVPIEGSEFQIEVDTVIIAIGNLANPLIRQTTPGLQFNKWGNIIVDENCKTSMEGVYAGGDIVLGAATVILAMGQGRIAAAAINQYLTEKKKTKTKS